MMIRKPYLHLRRIRTLYEKAPAEMRERGRHWYKREHAEARLIAEEAGLPVEHVCACLAVLSPRCQWPRVKAASRELLSGKKPRGFFNRNLTKAVQIVSSRNGIPIDPHKAPKTWAFWQNLWHPEDPGPVTLDSWMFRAHGLPARVGFAAYQTLAECYRRVARELSLIPNQLQATVWLHSKKMRNGKEGT